MLTDLVDDLDVRLRARLQRVTLLGQADQLSRGQERETACSVEPGLDRVRHVGSSVRCMEIVCMKKVP